MNKRTLLVGLLTSLVLAGCGMSETGGGKNTLQLPECTGTETVFASSQLDALPALYHQTVADVINAHLNELASLGTRPLACTANDYRGLLRPSQALSSLAATLPEWGPSRAETLSEADLGNVLLEYLRVYECALFRREQFLHVFILREQGTIPVSTLTKEQQRQQNIIEQEIQISRPALERTLAFLGGIDRLRPLSAELECLKRASLDLRNVTGLGAEAVSCMPKIWDARGSLRDLTDL